MLGLHITSIKCSRDNVQKIKADPPTYFLAAHALILPLDRLTTFFSSSENYFSGKVYMAAWILYRFLFTAAYGHDTGLEDCGGQ